MNRRGFFNTLGAVGAAAAVTQLPFVSHAKEGEVVNIEGVIGANHGHSVDVDIADVISMLRETKKVCHVQLDIKGASGHPHILELTHQNLIDLVAVGSLAVESSVVAGHAHSVEINLGVI